MWFESDGECCAWPNRQHDTIDVFERRVQVFRRCQTCRTYLRENFTLSPVGGQTYWVPDADVEWDDEPDNDAVHPYLIKTGWRDIGDTPSREVIDDDASLYESHTHDFTIVDIDQHTHDEIRVDEKCESPACGLRRTRFFWRDYWETEEDTMPTPSDEILDDRRASLDATTPITVLDAATEAVYEYDRTRDKRVVFRVAGHGPSRIPLAPDTVNDRIPEAATRQLRQADVGDVLIPLSDGVQNDPNGLIDSVFLSVEDAWTSPLTATVDFDVMHHLVADVIGAYAVKQES